jgi:hypothetical protein
MLSKRLDRALSRTGQEWSSEKLSVHFSTMAHRQNENHKLLVPYLADKSVVSYPVTPEASQAPCQRMAERMGIDSPS